MPLGYENNGVSAGLIERGGDLLAQSLIDTGKTIEGALIRSQAFKQARELGAAIQQTNPQSDDWPQQAAFLVSQYPLAAQSGLAKMVMEPVGKAYAGYQAAKVAGLRIQGQKDIAGLRIQGQKDIAGLRASGGNQPVYVGGGSPSPELTNQDPIDVVGKIGAGGLGGAMQAPDLGQPASVLPTLPDGTNADTSLPDAATAMSRRKSRPLQEYIDQTAKTYNDALAAKQAPPFNRSQISTIAARQKAADDKEISGLNATPKVKATLVDATGDLYRELADGSFLYPDGTKHVAAPNGLTRVAGAHEQERLDQTKQAAEQRTTRNEKTDVVKAAKSEYDDAVKMFQTENTLQHKLEASASKITDPELLTTNQNMIKEQQARAQAQKDRMEKALKTYQDALKTSGKVRVVKPDGTAGYIPKSQLEEALKAGYREQ